MWQACYLLDIEGLKATAALEALLDQERLQKYMRIKSESTALQSLGAGLLLQLAAGEFLEGKDGLHMREERNREGQRIPVIFLDADSMQKRLQTRSVLELTYRYNAYGKPYFMDIPLFFSLSHSGRQILCACSEQEIGADLQKVTGTDGKKIVRRFFSKEENDFLNGIPDDKMAKEVFYRLWTKKEAYGKLTGEGVLKVVDVPLLEGPENLYWQAGQFVSKCGEAYFYAVCEKQWF